MLGLFYGRSRSKLAQWMIPSQIWMISKMETSISQNLRLFQLSPWFWHYIEKNQLGFFFGSPEWNSITHNSPFWVGRSNNCYIHSSSSTFTSRSKFRPPRASPPPVGPWSLRDIFGPSYTGSQRSLGVSGFVLLCIYIYM